MTLRRGSGRAIRRLAALASGLAIIAPVLPMTGLVDATGAGVDGLVRASPISITFILAAAEAQVGQVTKAEARVTNLGAATLHDVAVELRVDQSGLSIRRALVQVASIKPGRSTTVSWQVCGVVAGSYVLLVRAIESGESVDSQARLLTVRAGGRRSCA